MRFNGALAAITACATLALGCASKGIGNSDGGIEAAIDGGANPNDGASCSTSETCAGGATCDRSTSTCVSGKKCSVHSECGKAAYCDVTAGECALSATGTACENKDNCAGQDECTGGFCGCNGLAITGASVVPNMLIVLDRSKSMDNTIEGKAKLTIAKNAIKNLVSSYDTKIRFGVALFPGKILEGNAPSCETGKVFTDIGASASTINDMINHVGSSHGTPTEKTLGALLSYGGLLDTSRPNYIVLVTDGMANCTPDINDSTPVDRLGTAVKAFRDRTPETKTFVIGFALDSGEDQLNEMAQEGGTAKSGDTKYFVANDAAALEAAFSGISGSVIGCDFSLKTVPSNLNQLYVFGDKQPIPQNDSNGWKYVSNSNSVTILGQYCADLKSGKIKNLAVVFGCNGQIN